MNILMSCIGRRGYIARYFRDHLSKEDQIIGASNTPWTPGFLACDKAFLLPSYSDESAYSSALLELCEKERIDALLSFMDQDVVILSKLIDELHRRGVTPVLPSAEAALICFDKWLSYLFYCDKGFKTALTFKDYQEAMSAISQNKVSFPLVVKPRFGFGSAHTYVIQNQRELDFFFNYREDMLIQERLVGEEFNLDILSNLERIPLAVIPWRKYSSRLGETEQAVTVESRPLVNYGVALAEALGLVGPMDVDLFVNGDSIQILEMNPRFGGGYPVSHLAEANFPSLIIRFLQGEHINPCIGNYKRGVMMMKELVPFGGSKDLFYKDLHICD
jgi:carbamoyl-phosphate synthase large subunit